MQVLQALLRDLAPYVWVAGSWARGTQHVGSDLDLAPRLNPNYDPGAARGEPGHRETLMNDVIAIVDTYELEWASQAVGQIHIEPVDGELIELYEGFVTVFDEDDPHEAHVSTHPVTVHGVEMVAADEQWLAATPWAFASDRSRAKFEQTTSTHP